MSEIYAFTASLGHNGLIDVFAIGDPGDDDSGTAVFLSRAAPGEQWSPWADAGVPDLGVIGLQSIASPARYGHILARAGGHEAAKDYGDLWFRECGENDDFSDWQGLGLPTPAAPGDPMIFGWMSGATTGEDGTIDVVGYADSTRHGAGMFIRSRLNPAASWGDWAALPENDSAYGPIFCIADDRGLDIITQVNVQPPGQGQQSGLSHLRRRSDFSWTDWELLDPVSGGFNPDIAPVLAYGSGGEDLNLFAVSTDNVVWHSIATEDGWSEWLSLDDPGEPVTGIAAVDDSSGQLNLFATRQDNIVTLRRQEGQAGPWWRWTALPTAADPIASHTVILDSEGCLNLLLARPDNKGIDILRQQGPGGAFLPVPSLPALPLKM
jgi:hypothetical protein